MYFRVEAIGMSEISQDLEWEEKWLWENLWVPAVSLRWETSSDSLSSEEVDRYESISFQAQAFLTVL